MASSTARNAASKSSAPFPTDAPLVVVEAVWQYSQHLMPGLLHHKGPILTVANWSGQWPGLVGLLNLNASLRKAGKGFDTLWSVDFTDRFFLDGLKTWLKGGPVHHDRSHVRPVAKSSLPVESQKLGKDLAERLKRDKALLGVFDEGCMGMYNAIIPDELLAPMGVFKERLSQSALYAEMLATSDQEARAVYDWLVKKGMTFKYGNNWETDLTEAQVLEQCKMYIATLRIADAFGCDVVGIQYQQGLKDLTPASDLAEGLLNNVDRPPVKDRQGKVLYPDAPLPHFNEVDEGVALDALVTNRVWTALGLSPETTLHDVRYGEDYDGRFIWTLEISGSVPPAHFAKGYAEAVSERQPPMYFRLGGGTIKGISKPGAVVWSRVYIEAGKSESGHGPGGIGGAADGRDRTALVHHHPAMADDAHAVSRHQPRPVHGPALLQPHPGGVCARQGQRRQGAHRQGGDVRRDGPGAEFLRPSRNLTKQGRS